MGGAEEKSDTYFLMCERNWIYNILITVAGFYGAFTYMLRGNVFCNAQTGNIVLMGMALGVGQWGHALYYLIPISAYLMGALISELVPNPIKHHLPLRWDRPLHADASSPSANSSQWEKCGTYLPSAPLPSQYLSIFYQNPCVMESPSSRRFERLHFSCCTASNNSSEIMASCESV